mgnify:CR=1 FL=1
MRAKMILALSYLIPFSLVCIYISTTATNYVYGDEIYVIKGGIIENYLNGTLALADLWRPFLSIRALGYSILLLADVKWFSMNSIFFILMIPFFLLISASLMFHEYRKSLIADRSPEFIAASFIFLSFIIFNVIQWEALTYRVSFFIQSAMPLIIASFISLESYITKGRKYWLQAFILPVLAVLVFGWTPVFAFAPALGLTFLCFVMTNRSLLTKDFWIRVLIISLLLIVIAFIYMFRIRQNDYLPYLGPEYFLIQSLAHPLEAMQFLLAAFGASIIGIDTFYAYDFFSFHHIAVIGFFVLLLYVLALFLFFRSRMYERTYLPFFLIIHVFFFLAFVTIARFGLNDIAMGMSSRYTCVSIYGLMSIIWIFVYFLVVHTRSSVLIKSLIGAGFVMIFTGLLLTSIVVWHVQPVRKANFEQLYDIAMRVDTATYDELLKFEAPPEQVRDSLRLLRQHKLNIYHSTIPVGK